MFQCIHCICSILCDSIFVDCRLVHECGPCWFVTLFSHAQAHPKTYVCFRHSNLHVETGVCIPASSYFAAVPCTMLSLWMRWQVFSTLLSNSEMLLLQLLRISVGSLVACSTHANVRKNKRRIVRNRRTEQCGAHNHVEQVCRSHRTPKVQIHAYTNPDQDSNTHAHPTQFGAHFPSQSPGKLRCP